MAGKKVEKATLTSEAVLGAIATLNSALHKGTLDPDLQCKLDELVRMAKTIALEQADVREFHRRQTTETQEIDTQLMNAVATIRTVKYNERQFQNSPLVRFQNSPLVRF